MAKSIAAQLPQFPTSSRKRHSIPFRTWDPVSASLTSSTTRYLASTCPPQPDVVQSLPCSPGAPRRGARVPRGGGRDGGRRRGWGRPGRGSGTRPGWTCTAATATRTGCWPWVRARLRRPPAPPHTPPPPPLRGIGLPCPCCDCGSMPRFSDHFCTAVLALPLRQPSRGRGPTQSTDGRGQCRRGVQYHAHYDLCHPSCRIQDVITPCVGSDRVR